jgi:hypothetical protein
MVQGLIICVVLPVFKVLPSVYLHGNMKVGYNTFLVYSNQYWVGMVRGNGVRVLTDFLTQKQKEKIGYHKRQYLKKKVYRN